MSRASSKVSLPELATEACLFALGMRDRASSARLSTVREGAIRLLDEFESNASSEQFAPADIADVKFALAAFIDEIVLNADWPGNDQWADDPLQLHYFGTYLAGAGFFEKLDALRRDARTRLDVLRVYFLCLQLGFRGKYGVGGMEILEALKKVIQNEIERELPSKTGDLCPHWQPVDKPRPQSDKLPRWLIYACMGVVGACILIYAILFFSMQTSKTQSGSVNAVSLLESPFPGGGDIA